MSPKSQENFETKTNEKKKLSRFHKGVATTAAGIIGLTAMVGCSNESGANQSPEPSPSVSESFEPTPVETETPTVDPNDIEAPGEKEWGKLEIPEADERGFREFGSDEDLINWFKIPTDIYSDPESLARKYALNGDVMMNMALGYQHGAYRDIMSSVDVDIHDDAVDPATWKEFFDIVREKYDEPAYATFTTSDFNTGMFISRDFKVNRGRMFIVSNSYREDEKPYMMTEEYISHELLSSSEDSLADSSEAVIRIKSKAYDNGLENVADWMREVGEPASIEEINTVDVTFVADNGNWLVKDVTIVDSEIKTTP